MNGCRELKALWASCFVLWSLWWFHLSVHLWLVVSFNLSLWLFASLPGYFSLIYHFLSLCGRFTLVWLLSVCLIDFPKSHVEVLVQGTHRSSWRDSHWQGTGDSLSLDSGPHELCCAGFILSDCVWSVTTLFLLLETQSVLPPGGFSMQ